MRLIKACLAATVLFLGACASTGADESAGDIDLTAKSYKQVRFVTPSVSLRSEGKTGKQFYIVGMIENMTSGYISGAIVKVEFFNEDGHLVAEEESAVLPRIIRSRGPGIGRFTISVPYNAEARSCMLDVTWQEKPGGEKDTSLLGQL